MRGTEVKRFGWCHSRDVPIVWKRPIRIFPTNSGRSREPRWLQRIWSRWERCSDQWRKGELWIEIGWWCPRHSIVSHQSNTSDLSSSTIPTDSNESKKDQREKSEQCSRLHSLRTKSAVSILNLLTNLLSSSSSRTLSADTSNIDRWATGPNDYWPAIQIGLASLPAEINAVSERLNGQVQRDSELINEHLDMLVDLLEGYKVSWMKIHLLHEHPSFPGPLSTPRRSTSDGTKGNAEERQSSTTIRSDYHGWARIEEWDEPGCVDQTQQTRIEMSPKRNATGLCQSRRIRLHSQQSGQQSTSRFIGCKSLIRGLNENNLSHSIDGFSVIQRLEKLRNESRSTRPELHQ